MSAGPNIIQKSTIQFRYPSRHLAIRCNELIEKIFATHILPKMDEAFSLKSFHGINLELASLEIDIGKIKEQDLERYLGEKIKEALVLILPQALSKKISFSGTSNTSPNPNGLVEEGLYFFLIKGFMPEWIAGMDMAKLMEYIFQSKPSYFKELLKKISRNRDAKKRWVFEISDKQFDRLIQNIEPSNSAWILSFRASLIPTLKKSKDLPSGKQGLDKSINYFILEFISVQSGSEFNRLMFSKSILKQTASRYNVGFLELIRLISKTLALNENQSPLFKNLQKVIVQIEKDELSATEKKSTQRVNWTDIFNTLSWEEIVRKFDSSTLSIIKIHFTANDIQKIKELNVKGIINLFRLFDPEKFQEILKVLKTEIPSVASSKISIQEENKLKEIFISFVKLKEMEPFEEDSKRLLLKAILKESILLERDPNQQQSFQSQEKYKLKVSQIQQEISSEKRFEEILTNPRTENSTENELGLKRKIIAYYFQERKLPHAFRDLSQFEVKDIFLDLLQNKDAFLKEIIAQNLSEKALILSIKTLLDKSSFSFFLTYLNHHFSGFAKLFRQFPSPMEGFSVRVLENQKFQNDLLFALAYSKGDIESFYFQWFRAKAHWENSESIKNSFEEEVRGFIKFSERKIQFDEKSARALNELYWYQKVSNSILLSTNPIFVKRTLRTAESKFSIQKVKTPALSKDARLILESLPHLNSGNPKLKSLLEMAKQTGNKPQIDSEQIFQILLFWQEKGYLPWWSPFPSMEKLSDSILKRNIKIKDENWESILDMLMTWQSEGKSRGISLDPKVIEINLSHFPKLTPASKKKISPNFKTTKQHEKSALEEFFELYSIDNKILDQAIYKYSDKYLLQKLYNGNSKIQGQIQQLLALSKFLYHGNFTGDKWRRMVFEFALAFFETIKPNYSARFDSEFLTLIRRKYSIFNWTLIFNSAYVQAKKVNREGDFPKIFIETFALETQIPEEKEDLEVGGHIKINNSGLVLTWPFLTMLFTRLGLIEGNRFKDETSQNRAVYLLQYLAFGDVDFPEYELVLNKLIVGMPLAIHLEPGIELTDEEKDLCQSLLKGMLQNWEKLKTSTLEALQVTFLQRVGELVFEDSQVALNVEKKGVDALMESISWNIKLFKLPWMEKAIQITWK
ncbi:contractile injection system tape measure protein [Cognataquiflexum aquatile]|uniref:contractile injection system tape measure protein n=1 Tax=Cognataquiflexum aquatile TaxID=2249427 RepID=UPI000DEBB1A7|nr:contractile injection system tape measure protein [Cognataquiflexum aquatile]